MFSGIVESVQPILTVESAPGVVRIQVQKPQEFDDLKIGDSIATNGVCLTVEKFDQNQMTFALAAETLQILELKADNLRGQKVNLERSLKFGDRIHGHLVTGHVDSLGVVKHSRGEGESLFLDIEVRDSLLPYLWKKGSITLHGVSLTVNDVQGSKVSVCLIPETLKRTNLGTLNVGDKINIEPDYMAKAVVRAAQLSKEEIANVKK